MSRGYVIDFSNLSFERFFIDSVGINIFDKKYVIYGESKANRLRAFWSIENNTLVSKVIYDLIEIWKIDYESLHYEEFCYEYLDIAKRLKNIPTVENIDAIQSPNNEKDFIVLVDQIKQNIKENKPEVSLDRLHTYLKKYIRLLSRRYSILYDKEKPLHSIFGEYIKKLKKEHKLKTEMSERILKTSISIIDSFNEVRNNYSYAHDNPILGYNESLLILNNISNLVKFIDTIENDTKEEENYNDFLEEDEDIPF